MGRLRIDMITAPPGRLLDAGGRVLVPRCHLADGHRARLVGLLGTGDLGHDEALWIPRCRSIHTLGMRVPIACAFLDASGRVIRLLDPAPSGWFAGACAAHSVVECAVGALCDIGVHDTLRFDPAPPAILAPSAHFCA